MFADGSNGSVEFLGDAIVIRRKGFANKMTQGFQGDKRIPMRSITAVQFRPSGPMMAGMIQFSMLGGQEYAGGMLAATRDENAVMFTRDQEPAFVELRDVVQNRIERGDQPAIVVGSGGADELERLAALMEKGHLTPDEFAEAKRRVLTGGGHSALLQPSTVRPQPSHSIRASLKSTDTEPPVAQKSGGVSRDMLYLVAALLILSMFGAVANFQP